MIRLLPPPHPRQGKSEDLGEQMLSVVELVESRNLALPGFASMCIVYEEVKILLDIDINIVQYLNVCTKLME